MSVISSAVVFFTRILNSSPPVLPIIDFSPKVLCKSLAKLISASSPFKCPCKSFTDLKSSISVITRVQGSSSLVSKYLSTSSLNPYLLLSPVKSSVLLMRLSLFTSMVDTILTEIKYAASSINLFICSISDTLKLSMHTNPISLPPS